jgi:hydrogenase nickel incorporation protein HypB
MCDTCGCNVTHGNAHLVTNDGKLARTEDGKSAITVLKNLLTENDHQAAHNRQHFDQQSILAINLMSSPGSGKTALLEATIDALGDEFSIAVIEGDLETENDAQRIRDKGVPALQITTGSACHLDAHMVHDALHHMDLEGIDILFIENVGNLVCPASFDLGQHRNITLLSVTEGDDKPAKYPVIFRAADLVLLTKTDLLEVLDDFDPKRAEKHLRQLATEAPMLQLASRRNIDIDNWLNWLRCEVEAQRGRVKNNQTLRPNIQPEGAVLHDADNHLHDGHGHSHHHPHSHSHSHSKKHSHS